jgi:hypothetical protein
MAERKGRYWALPYLGCNGAPNDPPSVQKTCNRKVQHDLYLAVNDCRIDDKSMREVEHLIKDTLAWIDQTERPTPLSLETCRPIDQDHIYKPV